MKQEIEVKQEIEETDTFPVNNQPEAEKLNGILRLSGVNTEPIENTQENNNDEHTDEQIEMDDFELDSDVVKEEYVLSYPDCVRVELAVTDDTCHRHIPSSNNCDHQMTSTSATEPSPVASTTITELRVKLDQRFTQLFDQLTDRMTTIIKKTIEEEFTKFRASLLEQLKSAPPPCVQPSSSSSIALLPVKDTTLQTAAVGVMAGTGTTDADIVDPLAHLKTVSACIDTVEKFKEFEKKIRDDTGGVLAGQFVSYILTY